MYPRASTRPRTLLIGRTDLAADVAEAVGQGVGAAGQLVQITVSGR